MKQKQYLDWLSVVADVAFAWPLCLRLQLPKGHPMIIFDIRIGRFSILAQSETFQRTFKVTHEAPGEIIVDLPSASITFTNEKRATKAPCSQGML